MATPYGLCGQAGRAGRAVDFRAGHRLRSTRRPVRSRGMSFRYSAVGLRPGGFFFGCIATARAAGAPKCAGRAVVELVVERTGRKPCR